MSTLQQLVIPGRQTRVAGEGTLQGEIPPEVGLLKQLDTLILSGQNLAGRIPSTLNGVANLRILNLSDNKLIGPLPNELRTLERLEEVSVSKCHNLHLIEYYLTSLLLCARSAQTRV